MVFGNILPENIWTYNSNENVRPEVNAFIRMNSFIATRN
jgi:hypothetical protein